MIILPALADNDDRERDRFSIETDRRTETKKRHAKYLKKCAEAPKREDHSNRSKGHEHDHVKQDYASRSSPTSTAPASAVLKARHKAREQGSSHRWSRWHIPTWPADQRSGQKR